MPQETIANLVRYDWPVWQRHSGITAFAEHAGVPLKEAKRLVAEVGPAGDRVSWAKVSDGALWLVMEALAKSSEGIGRFASRYNYSSSGLTKALSGRFPDEWKSVHAAKMAGQSANKYALGANFERRVMAKLERLGFVVVRSAGSHSFVDVVAMKNGKAMLVQCKRGGILPLDEWNGLVRDAEKAGALPVMVENPHRGEVRWWILEGEREKGSSGSKRRLFVP